MSQHNVDVVRGFYEAVHRRDFERLFSFIDEHVEWIGLKPLPWGGVFHGHDGVRTYFQRALEANTELVPEPYEYVASGDKVVSLSWVRGVARTTGRPWKVQCCHVWTVRNGKIVAMYYICDVATIMDALGQSTPR
ncbi:nuclear transport factor 2 family protein [Sorangium sp. So ce131]|uniref:nuclear transport factor 2 family protein n=1 Tax=Sorangium sp. So ce131 TaxID=3133282 RepID=UPI003F630EFE